MNFSNSCRLLLLLSASIPFSLFAEAQGGLSLHEALVRAISANPLIAAAQGRIRDAQGQSVQAGLRPNPRLLLQTEDIRPSTNQTPFSFVNSTEDYITVGQTIEAGGKRARRVDLASASIKSTELEQAFTRLQIEARVETAYWLASSADRNYRLQEESLRTYEQDVTYTRNRVNEGVTAEADLVRIELERDRIQTELLRAKSAAGRALVKLYQAMGSTDFVPVVLTESMESLPSPTVPKVEDVLLARPELRLARQSVAEAQENLRLQRAVGKPDPEVLVGYKRNVGFDTLYAAFQIDLPVRNRNQGNVLSAQARLDVARENVIVNEAAVRAEFKVAELAYADLQEIVKALPATLAKAQQAEEMARAAYREGGIDLLRLLDVERSRIQTQTDYYRALAELRQSVVQLRVAAGEDLLVEVRH